MAQSDQTIANATFPSVRADINDNLAALFSNNLGASAPSTLTGGMWFFDTTNNCLKIRSEDNNEWYSILKTDGVQFYASGNTAALPAFSKYDDVNTGLFFPTADTVGISTGGSEALRITDGKVGIGTTSPDSSLHVLVNSGIHRVARFTQGDTSQPYGYNEFYFGSNRSGLLQWSTASIKLSHNSGTGIVVNTTGIGIGVASPAYKFHIEGPSGTGTNTLMALTKDGGYAGTVFKQYWNSATDYGLILGWSATSMTINHHSQVITGDFNDTSDEKQKTNIEDLTFGLNELKKIRPCTFDWLDEKRGTKKIGFIAQEVEKILPNDVVGEDGDKAINVTAIVSLLVKSVQELSNKIDGQ